jgi:hypothetical protein
MLTPDDVKYAFPGGFSGLNLYAYCLDNPETFIDSSGNFPNLIAKVAEGVVVVGIGFFLGVTYRAITPLRATAVATLSSSIGALLFTPGEIIEMIIEYNPSEKYL